MGSALGRLQQGRGRYLGRGLNSACQCCAAGPAYLYFSGWMRSRSLCPPPSPPGAPRAASEVSAHRRAQTAHPLLIARDWAGRPAAKPACPPHPLPSSGLFPSLCSRNRGLFAMPLRSCFPSSRAVPPPQGEGCRQPAVPPASPHSRDEIHGQGDTEMARKAMLAEGVPASPVPIPTLDPNSQLGCGICACPGMGLVSGTCRGWQKPHTFLLRTSLWGCWHLREACVQCIIHTSASIYIPASSQLPAHHAACPRRSWEHAAISICSC